MFLLLCITVVTLGRGMTPTDGLKVAVSTYFELILGELGIVCIVGALYV